MNNNSAFEVMKIVTASADMPPEKVALIARRFAEHLHIQGYTIEQETDTSLIGGYVIYAQGTKYDYSVRGQLSRIGRHLKTDRGEESKADLDDASEIHRSLTESLADFKESPAMLFDEDDLWEGDSAEQEAKREKILTDFAKASEVEQIGKVLSVADGVAKVSGLENCMASELIMFSETSYGIAMNLEKNEVGVVLLNECRDVVEGVMCHRTGLTVSVPVGRECSAVLSILSEIRSTVRVLSEQRAEDRSRHRHRISLPDLRSANRSRPVLPQSMP